LSPLPPSEARRRSLDLEVAKQTSKGHGRIEHRTLEATDILCGYINWPGLARVCRITRRRIERKKKTREVVYAITSLPKDKADALSLLRLSRAHWAIENRLFCVRDVTLREDQCRVRSGSAPQVLAALRNAALTLLRQLGFTNIVEGLEYFMENRANTISFIRYGRIE